MLDSKNNEKRMLRQERVRKRVRGTDQKPRLCVFRSARHIYAQVISDEAGKTLVSASTLSAELRGAASGEAAKAKKLEVAKKVGELVARRCLEQQISHVIFDRNGFLYHGRIKALADAAREAGLKF